MDITAMAFSIADDQYYEPLERGDGRSRQFRPTAVPDGWSEYRHEVWRNWTRPDLAMVDQGWKIHVSARLDRADAVLDTVADVCFTASVPFKHLTSEMTFIFSHHKHGTRSQAGKFCAIYPPDEATARRLLEELSDRLRDEDGPYILSDRRYRDSRTVHYRYGAFRTMSRIRPDGTPEHLVRDGAGKLVEDVRSNRFVLPEAVTDPFAAPAPVPAPGGSSDDGVRIGEYRVLRALAQSNAGGAYQAVAPDGTTVFMKEARAHNGLDWERSTAQQRLRHEHRVLTDLHARAPGLAPQPLAYLREWEHEFLVTELVPGEPLARLLTRRNPYIQASAEADFVAYFAECRQILSRLEAILDRLHRAGYRFGDLNPRNILVTEDGQVRLIDFESCGRLDEPPIIMGVPGFAPTRRDQWEGTLPDEYGFAAIAFGLVMPVHQFALLHPPTLDHLYADARRQAYEVPADLWRVAVRNFATVAGSDRRPSGPDVPPLPTPEEVATDPIRHLRWLRDSLGRDLTREAAPDDPYRMYPTVPQGHLTNTLCVAFGAAGVLHALHHAGLPIDERVVDRLRREALAEHAKPLPPGLHYGAAGIGWVLAELGHLDEAVDLVAAAESHPALAYTGGSGVGRGDLGVGTAGIGAARLALSALTGDPRHVDEAARIGDDLCRVTDLVPLVGPRNAIGLLHGRAGIALFLHHLWRATGDKRYLDRGTALLHQELDRAIEMPGGELGFSDDDVSPRIMAYLAIGSAGVGHVLTRYVHTGGDERLAGAIGRVFAYADKLLTVEPGLYQGLAGLAFAHADHADLAGADDPASRDRAVRLATALFKYVTPAAVDRVRVLGQGTLRFSTELWSGSAGVLLAVDRVLSGSTGHFFTLDELLPADGRSSARVGTGTASR